MADAGPVPDANSIDMAVSTPGKDASDPDKTTARKALFQSTPKAPDKTENVSTPSTGEKRHTRENNIMILRGCDPNIKPEQATSLLVKTIEAEPALAKTENVTTPATGEKRTSTGESMKSTEEALINLTAHINIFMNHVLDKMLQKDVEDMGILMSYGTYLLAQVTSLAACARATCSSPPPPSTARSRCAARRP